MTTCPMCHAELKASAQFCGACGAAVTPTAAAPAAAPRGGGHVIAAPGQQGYAMPDPSSAFGPVFAGGTQVAVLEVRSAWAYVQDGTGRAAWVDGRLLVPPAIIQAGAPPAPYGSAPTSTDPGFGPGNVVAIIAALLVVAGSSLNWYDYSYSSFSSHESAFGISFSALFDQSFLYEFKIGQFLLIVAVIALAFSWVRKAGWVRILCGVLALATAVDWIRKFSGDLGNLGPGVWVTAVAGILLAISPAFPGRR